VAIKHTSTSIVLPLTQHAILETYRTLFFILQKTHYTLVATLVNLSMCKKTVNGIRF